VNVPLSSITTFLLGTSGGKRQIEELTRSRYRYSTPILGVGTRPGKVSVAINTNGGRPIGSGDLPLSSLQASIMES
jgi:hypothetical protein